VAVCAQLPPPRAAATSGGGAVRRAAGLSPEPEHLPCSEVRGPREGMSGGLLCFHDCEVHHGDCGYRRAQ
jgi:hypothetical protein